MPDLSFQVEGAEPVAFAASPLLALKLRVRNAPAEQPIHSVLLRCQVQIDAPWRVYQAREEEALRDLFGAKERWATTLKKVLWMNVAATVPAFVGSAAVDLHLPCTYDLNVAATKYFHAVEKGEVPLLLLFSGTVFYEGEDGFLQVAQIPWSKEASLRMPVRLWKDVMDMYFPNTGFVPLRRDVLDRLHRYKVTNGLPTFEQAMESLLPADPAPALPPGADA
ncbi:MAG: DUF6084 family protein [Myxococcales bacterium]